MGEQACSDTERPNLHSADGRQSLLGVYLSPLVSELVRLCVRMPRRMVQAPASLKKNRIECVLSCSFCTTARAFRHAVVHESSEGRLYVETG